MEVAWEWTVGLTWDSTMGHAGHPPIYVTTCQVTLCRTMSIAMTQVHLKLMGTNRISF